MKAEKGELFRFRFLTEVRFGVGIRHKLNDYIGELCPDKIVLVVDQQAAKSERTQEAIATIHSCGEVLQMDGPKSEPELSELEKLREEALSFNPNVILGLGGGSTLDMAKGLAAVLPNSKPASEYQGFDKLEKKALPCLLIPTLFGAGTEVTASAVMINREKMVKGGINGRFVFPTMAVIDPELGLGAPLNIMGATALDALVHCIEGYVAKCATPLSRMFSRQAALLIMPALFKLAKNSESIEALEDIAFASLLAITGLMHSESGVCGAISYPLGIHHGVPHGLGGGLVMPKAILVNCEKGCTLYSDLSGAIYNPEIAARKLSDSIQELISLFGLPGLSKFGVRSEKIEKLANEIFAFKGVLDMNPVKIDSPEIIGQLIESAI
jgi:alcohol dehydrogenase class IV